MIDDLQKTDKHENPKKKSRAFISFLVQIHAVVAEFVCPASARTTRTTSPVQSPPSPWCPHLGPHSSLYDRLLASCSVVCLAAEAAERFEKWGVKVKRRSEGRK